MNVTLKFLFVIGLLVSLCTAQVHVYKFDRDDDIQTYEGSAYEYHCIDDTGRVQGKIGLEMVFEGYFFPENDTAHVTYYGIGGEIVGETVLMYNGSSIVADTPFTWSASNRQNITADPFSTCLWTATPQTKTIAGYWDDENQPNYLCVNAQNVTGSYIFKYNETSEEFGRVEGKPFGWNQFSNYFGTFFSQTGPYKGQSGPLLFKADLTLAKPAMHGFSCFKSGELYTECFEESYELVSSGDYVVECVNGPPTPTTTGGSTTGSAPPSSSASVIAASTSVIIALLAVAIV